MKDDDLLKAIGGINEKYINEADLPAIRPVKYRRRIMQTVVAAAGIALVAGTALVIPRLLRNEPADQIKPLSTDYQPIDTRILSFGVDVPAIDLAGLTEEEITEKFTSVLVYEGNVYTRSDTGTGIETDAAEALLDQNLGTAKNLFETSSEIRSNLKGDVYSLKGYGTDFRLCVKQVNRNDAGGTGYAYEILERLNGISLSVGSDLFEYRLHLSELTEHAFYETADSRTKIERETWNDVLDAMDSAAFTALTESGEVNARLVLTMKDGTEVRLILTEGGYVGYENLDGYFVKIPEETINKLYALRKGNIK
jgi:hypothetical protein